MGPADPWSANWRPDPTGQRLARIRTARRGAVLAVLAYIPVAIAVIATDGRADALVVRTLVTGVSVGTLGVALLGAGLAPAALGSRIDAAVAAVAFGVGTPVAAVTSFVIAGFLADALIAAETSYALDILRGGVMTAMRVAPLLAVVAALWVMAVRRSSRASVSA